AYGKSAPALPKVSNVQPGHTVTVGTARARLAAARGTPRRLFWPLRRDIFPRAEGSALPGAFGSAWRAGPGWPCSSSAPADGFCRKPGNETESPLHPPGERVIRCEACRLDANEAGQSPASELHRPHVRFAERLLTALGADPDHQRRTRDAAAHVAVDQERQA